MTTEQAVTLESLWAVHDRASAKRDLKATTAAMAEIKKFENAQREFQVQAEAILRDTALDTIKSGLKAFDLAPLRQALQVNGRVTRGEDGKFDNLVIQVGLGDLNLVAPFYAAFVESELTNLETVNGVNFTIKRGEIMVEYTGRRAKTGTASRNGGKGWSKAGSPLTKLGDIFNAYATDAEKAKAAEANAKGDGSGEYRAKTEVAKREGFEQNS